MKERPFMNMSKKKLIGDIVAGIIILLGSNIPRLVINGSYFVYMEDKESLYTMEYMLTTLLLFVSVLYLAYFIKNIFSGKYDTIANSPM